MPSFIKAVAVCSAIALMTSAGAFAHGQNPLELNGRGPALFSYDQAKALGIDVDSAKRSGLSECPSVPYIDKGITSEDGAEAIAAVQERDNAPRCYSPVRNMKFGVGAPPPHSGTTIPGYPNSYYHWTGWNTFGHPHWGEGVQFQMEIADPSVTAFTGEYEFVAARVMLIDDSSNWTEAGWYEYNYFTGNNQCAYGYATPENVHHFDCSSYPLTVGSLYTFRTEQLGEDGEDGVGGFVYYADAWRLLVYNDQMSCVSPISTSDCYLDVELEVETDVDANRHVILNGGDFDGVGVTFHLGKVKKIADDSWNSASTYSQCANTEINNDSPDYKMVKRTTLDIRNSFRVARTGTAYTTCP